MTEPSCFYTSNMTFNNQHSWGGPFPSLHMWPVQETFSMKMIHLPEGQRVCRYMQS